jgi:hypothetical protein
MIIVPLDEEEGEMPSALKHAVLGFAAAVVSVLSFHQATWEVLHLLALPGLALPAPYPLDPVVPFGLPRIVNYCLLSGICGLVFGLATPRMRGPLWLWGLGIGVIVAAFGLLTVSGIKHFLPGARWIPFKYYTEIMTIVLTYGLPMSGSMASPLTWIRSLLVDGAWGIGLGLILPRLGLRPSRQSRQ